MSAWYATFDNWLAGLGPGGQLLIGSLGLMLASQLVIAVLDRLEQHQFGPVQLGTLVTPLCTGFPNLMIGRERLQGDLVLHLNIGNNLANTSLVTGLVLFAAGPLMVRPAKGSGKKARRWNQSQWMALAFLWLGALALFLTARDGSVDRRDGLILIAIYLVHQYLGFRARGKPSRKARLGAGTGLVVLLLFVAAALVIQWSVQRFGVVLDAAGDLFPGAWLGLFLGLLTVIPESFLLLRLALQRGSLGFSGLLGDCLVSVPLVIGVSALLVPFATAPVTAITDAAFKPYAQLMVTMTAFSLLAVSKGTVSRKTGLIFMGLYAMVWWHARS